MSAISCFDKSQLIHCPSTFHQENLRCEVLNPGPVVQNMALCGDEYAEPTVLGYARL